MHRLIDKLRRVTSNKIYYPEIDGIRFLAISVVFLFHAYGYYHTRFDSLVISKGEDFSLLNEFLINGDRGVQLFFVLSGFILCLPFAEHYINSSKAIDLKFYYVRRFTRLEPPYFVAMIILFGGLIITKVYSFSFLFPSLLASLIYCHNLIFHHTPWVSVVAWSLEIEIQFYLIAPILFRVLRLELFLRRFVLVSLCISVTIMQFYYIPDFLSVYNQLQYFLAGILLADIYVSKRDRSYFDNWYTVILAFLTVFLLFLLPLKIELYAQLTFPFLIILFYCFILYNRIMKSVFSYGWIPIIGGMCYSIYMLHYAVISVVGRYGIQVKIGNDYIVNMIVQFGYMMVSVLVVSSLFYLLVERPFMEFKLFKVR